MVPKETTRAMKKMFKFHGRTESQTINLFTMRMSLPAFKRSHQICTRIYKRNSCIDNIYKPEIRSYDTPDEILDKKLGAFQNEMSASDYVSIGNPTQNRAEMTNENYDQFFVPPIHGRSDILDQVTVKKRLLKNDEEVVVDKELDVD
jgi:hypothetical protein